MKFDANTIKVVTKTGKRYMLTDSTRTGLVLRVSAAGCGTFHYRSKVSGLRKEVALRGSWEQVLESYEYHRAKATRPAGPALVQVDQLYLGADLATLCSRFLQEYVRVRLARTTFGHYEYFLDRLLAHMKGHPAIHGRGTIFETQQEVRKLLKRVRDTESKPVMCNRMKSCFSSMFKWALEEELVTQNPIHSMPTGVEIPKTRRLADGEIGSFAQVLAAGKFSASTTDALRLILLTGLRSGEVLKLTRGMFSPELDTLLLPATITKNKREFLVTLSPAASTILTRNIGPTLHPQKAIFPTSTWGLRQVCIRACKRGGVTKCTPHDLRRTFATLCGSLGVDVEVIGKLLNHSAVGVTSRHYNLYAYQKEKRAAVLAAQDRLLALGLAV